MKSGTKRSGGSVRIAWLAVLVVIAGCAASGPEVERAPERPAFDVVGHRGARGLLPENSLPSFRRALELGVNTIEIDVVASGDSQVVVSHEPWMHHDICATPEGEPVTEAEERSLNLYEMTYEEIARYDCGSRGHAGFPRQEPMDVRKPLLRDVIEMGEEYVRTSGRAPAWYNIEIKSNPEWDGRYAPAPETFIPMVHDVLVETGVRDRAIVQSFDPRPLRVMRELDPSIPLALLVGGSGERSMEEHVEALGFVPDSYNPHYRLVDAELVERAHARGMTLVPWTVNDAAEMRRLLALGVDGLITDYPDLAPARPAE